MIKRRKSDGQWLVNIKPGGRNGVQFKRVFETQKEAKAFEIWANNKVQQEPDWVPRKKDSRKLSELVDRWFVLHGSKLSDSKKRFSLLKKICESLGNPTAVDLKASDFAEHRATRIEQGISFNTTNHELAYLRAVFNELSRLGEWEQKNPVGNLKAIKLQEKEMSSLNPEQVQVLIKALDEENNIHVKLVTIVCLSTGARWAEAEGLNITQVKTGVLHFANITKSRKARGVPISDELEKALKDHHSKHGVGQKIFGPSIAAFRRALARSKIETPKGQASHVLRHTFASEVMRKGGNILVLQRALGHQSLAMTMRYAHLAPDHLMEVRKLNPLSDIPVGSLLEAKKKPQDHKHDLAV